jgi:hypothetical protein
VSYIIVMHAEFEEIYENYQCHMSWWNQIILLDGDHCETFQNSRCTLNYRIRDLYHPLIIQQIRIFLTGMRRICYAISLSRRTICQVLWNALLFVQTLCTMKSEYN